LYIYNGVLEGITYVGSERCLVILSLTCSRLKGLFDALVLHGTCLNVDLCLVCLDPLLLDLVTMYSVQAIDLVGYQDNWYLFAIVPGRRNENLSPFLKVIVGFRIGNVENEYAAVTATIERGAETLEPFLSCCVPDLQVNLLTILKAEFLLSEFRPNCRFC
jgi:hypothetical protein